MIDDDTLDLVDTNRLIEAIQRRCDAMVLAYVKPAGTVDKDESARIWFEGGLYTALGLVEQIRHDLVTRNVFVKEDDE